MIRHLLVVVIGLIVAIAPATARGDFGIGDAGIPGSGLIVDPTILFVGTAGPGQPLTSSFDVINTESLASITVTGYLAQAGANCAQFTITPPRAFTYQMAPQQMDVWGVSFTATAVGFYSCRIDIQDSDGNLDFIDLQAQVASPVMVVSPTTIDFGDVVIGSPAWDTFFISNQGSAPLDISAVTPSGSTDFVVMSPPTPFQVTPGNSIGVSVMYSPGSAGSDSGSVLISGNDPANPSDVVTLNGNGVTTATGPHLTLSPNPMAFNPVLVGSSADRTLSIGNDGGQDASVSLIEITGPDAADFTIEGFGCTGTQSCPVALLLQAAGAPATGALRCRPLSPGNQVATVTVTSNATNTPTSAALTCTGDGADVVLDRTALDFGTIRVGSNASLDLTVSNAGNLTLSYTLSRSGAAAADYAASPACAVTACTLAPGAFRVHSITFAPTVLGNRNALLIVASNDPLEPTRNVSLTGIGGGGVLTLVQPGSGNLPFGDIPVTTTSSPQTVQIRNDGNLSLRVTSIALDVTTAFGLTGTTAPPDVVLGPGQSHSLGVTCTPPQAMTYNAVLTYQSDAPTGATRTVNLSCRGINSNLVAVPAPVSFLPTRVGDARVVNVTVSNTGGATVSVTGLTASPGVFSIEGAPGLPHSVPGGGDFDLDLRFTPTGDGDVAGALTITPSTGDPLMVVLLGPGRIASFTLTPESGDFGTVCSGSTSVQRFTLASTGSADFEVALPALTDPDGAFDLSMISPVAGSYPITIAPSGTATMDVAAAPIGATAAGTLEISTDVDDGDRSVELMVVSIDDGVAVSPGTVEFGTVPVGEQSITRDVMLSNCDPTPLDITAVRLTGSDENAFAVGGTLPPPTLTVPVAGNREWSVVFSPERDGEHEAFLEIVHASDTMTVRLTGVGGVDAPDAGPGGGDGGPGDGGVGLDTTSYYACWCRAPAGDPGGAVPVLLVLAFLLWPRRRRR